MEAFVIRYGFRFADGTERSFELCLDATTMEFSVPPPADPPDWTFLEHHRCPSCRLDPAADRRCPVAVRLAPLVSEFSRMNSCDETEVTVTTEQRQVVKTASLWEGLSALIGIVMASGGCPGLQPLKPLVRFHLPFASVEETTFRMISLSLVAEHLRRRRGAPAGEPLQGLHDLYAEVVEINAAFADRLRSAVEKDAHVNALVNLDAFAQLVPLSLDDFLDLIEPSFDSWFSSPSS